MVPGDCGCVTRSGISYGYDKAAFAAMAQSRFKKILYTPFKPWPKWMLICNDVFNFSHDLTIAERQASFLNLLDCPSGATPLVEDEKQRLTAECTTLILNAEKACVFLMTENKQFSQTELWYELLTKEFYFKHCKRLNAFALKFLNRSFNKGIVEVKVSSLKNISTEKRLLQQKTTEMLNFICTNGPHPLVAMPLVDDFLNAYFGNDWRFTVNQSRFFVS